MKRLLLMTMILSATAMIVSAFPSFVADAPPAKDIDRQYPG